MLFIKILSTALFFYTLVEKAGLFSEQAPSLRAIFHSYPFLGGFSALAIACAWQSFPRGRVRKPAIYGRCLLVAGALLAMTGLWVSYLTYFEGHVLRMDKQDFLTLPGEYTEGTSHQGKLAKPNSIGIYIKEISFRKIPFMHTPLAQADIRYISKGQKAFADTTISRIRPLYKDWTMVRVTGSGYSVAYALNDQTDREVDRTYVALKLSPPGEEDYFSPKDFGYYFHIRYYPDYYDANGQPATRSLEQKNPMLGVRVVRNKDILYNGLVSMNNTLDIEGVRFRIKDVRPCVEITVIRDPGLPVLLAGLLLAMAGVCMLLPAREKK